MAINRRNYFSLPVSRILALNVDSVFVQTLKKRGCIVKYNVTIFYQINGVLYNI